MREKVALSDLITKLFAQILNLPISSQSRCHKAHIDNLDFVVHSNPILRRGISEHSSNSNGIPHDPIRASSEDNIF